MANWNNPTLTSTYTNFVTEVKDRDVEAAVWFEGMSPTNLPTNAKRLNTSTGRFEKWNGSAWVDAVATFTFPALSVAGVSTFTGVATFTANPVMNGGTVDSIAYLGADKVLTTNGLLTFDGSTMGVGNGTAQTGIDIRGAATGGALRGLRSGVAQWFFGDTASALGSGTGLISYLYNPAHPFIWTFGAAEAMRLNGTGLGVGVTPAGPFHVKTDSDHSIQLRTNSSGVGARLVATNLANTDYRSLHIDGTTVTFNISGVEAATFNASRNMAIGTADATRGRLTISEANKIFDGWGNLNVISSSAAAADSGAALVLGGENGQGTSPYVFGKIKGAKEAGGNWAGYLAIGTTRGTSAVVEAARWDSSGNYIADASVTGYWRVPRGTTAQRPTGAGGMIRFNNDLNKYEGHNGTSWSSIGGGATGGGADDIFYENGQTVTTNYTITSGKNAMSAGPVTIASGITVTVPSGSTWVVV